MSKAAEVALELANTWDPSSDDPELLPDLAALRRFLRFHGVRAIANAHDLDAVRALRARVRAIVAADDPVARLDALARRLRAVPAVDETGELMLEAPPKAPLHDRLALRAVSELAEIVRDHGAERLRTCAASPCEEAFVDESKNASRRYCSRRCANRVNAARHRSRI
jgi:predicted RNA-binding Zn ribbon-like protein